MPVFPGTSADLDLDAPLSCDDAAEHVLTTALADGPAGRVGLELETHAVDLADAARHVDWRRLTAAVAGLGDAAGDSAVTLEPGGQVELSGPPRHDVATAVAELRRDLARVRLALSGSGLGLAHAGADPLRPARRLNPRPRYAAMERHFAATGRGAAGRTMMCSTAALQVNLDAGPRADWRRRVTLAQQLGPAMVALSACSPWLAGHDTRWRSARRHAWAELDTRECGPLPGRADPAQEWAEYALAAPVLFVRSGDEDAVAVERCVSFARWASGQVRLDGRSPTLADLHTHLTTLFPPVRLRGYLEIRYLDTSPPRWWPAVTAVLTALLDDPVAADLATEASEPTAALWREAARDGLRDPRLAAAARRCLQIAADRVPAALHTAVADLADLVASGRCPGDLLAERIGEVGPHRALEELAHA